MSSAPAAPLAFSLVHAALIAPMPYADADRLHVVLSLPDYEDLRASTDAFEETGLWASNLHLLDDEQITGGTVTPGFFQTLGVRPVVGRVVEHSDEASPVVVLSHALWQRRFGGDIDAIGRTVVLSGRAYTVIGVMPPAFQFPARRFELWVNQDAALGSAPQQRETARSGFSR